MITTTIKELDNKCRMHNKVIHYMSCGNSLKYFNGISDRDNYAVKLKNAM